ncbi:kynureninase [Wukongibacter baidiensis]|uniref:kynureninase n=1 Tax=Wukongibacter baidiensis TaxID=1723361 RepID=UPI003D7FBA9E
MNYDFKNGRESAQELDKADKMRMYRERFYLNEGEIYMDGNSLGLCSKDAEKTLLRVLDEWKKYGIGCWSEPDIKLFLYQDYLGELLAPLIGAEPKEVTVHTNTTMNIHTSIGTFYKPTKKRYKILVDDLNFPTDRHAIDGQIKLKGLDPEKCVKVVKSRDGKMIYEEDVVEAMTDDVCIVFLPSVLYRSGQLVDMEYITKEAHKRDIIVGWDLCHSIGAVPHDFKRIDPDFAVWCNYKYLNGGPGAVAGLFINKKHFDKEAGLPGWHANVKETQFELNHRLDKAKYAGGWQSGTQSILSMAPLEGSLKMYAEAGIDNLREKSLKITEYLMYLIEIKLVKYGFSIGNPREDSKRGGHVALEHDDAIRINEALKSEKVIPDFRYPNVIRLAPVPLYVSYGDVYELVERIVDIMENKKYDNFENKIGAIA